MSDLRTKRSAPEHGAALVVTLIVCTVLATVVVAMMQNATLDRASSRSIATQYRAKLAAEAGTAVAESFVADLVRRYPDSVTVWQNIGGGPDGAAGTNNEATVLYVRAQSANTNLGSRPAQFSNDVTFLAIPLVSRVSQTNSTLLNTNMLPLASIFSNLPYVLNNPAMINLNSTNNLLGRPWVGRRPATNAGAPSTAPVMAAQWIYLGASPGPTNAGNPAVARYAFWVEDESFKVNVNVATNGLRGAASLGLSSLEARVDGSWITSRNSQLRTTNASGDVLAASNAIRERVQLPGSNFPTVLTAAIAARLTDNEAVDELKFLTTGRSAGLDLSRGGFKRLNINSVTNGALGPTDSGFSGSDNKDAIRANLSRVIAAITNSNSVPNFGQRFYRLTGGVAGINSTNINITTNVTTNHAAIYLNKIAANILDYVDQDDQPTIINVPTNTSTFTSMSDFTIRAGKPTFGIEALGGGLDGANSAAAMGVENFPRLQEYVIHGRIRRLDPIGFRTNSAPSDPKADYEISIDHYFEFWNPGVRDITINDAFLKIYDQPAFGTSITGPLATEGRPTSEIPVNGVLFPAGQVTVLTTAPTNEINTLLVGANASRVVSLPVPKADRIFAGETRDVSTNTYGTFNRLFNVSLKARQTSLTDYESAVLIGNGAGVLESYVGLPIVVSGGSVPALHFVVSSDAVLAAVGSAPNNFTNGNAYFARGGSLRGNSSNNISPLSTEGDPRALNEQLEWRVFDSSSPPEQTRFFTTGLGNGSVPSSNSTVGAPNTNFVFPTNWVDYSSTMVGAVNAPLVVRNGPMQSIGDLGHLTDPARVQGTNGSMTNIVYSRGGGRTLRVGQSEVFHAITNRAGLWWDGNTNTNSWWIGNQTNASRTWTAWRLADIFTTTAASNNATARDPQGNLTNSLGVVRGRTNTNGVVLTIPGLINPNGLLRDNGAAMRSTLYGTQMLASPDGAPNTAGIALRANNAINVVLSNALTRMTNTNTWTPLGALNPLWERGEISELSVFNGSTNLLGVDMRQVFDRGREELVRRSIEMITTRGSIFTVYVIGQGLQGTNVSSTVRLKQTFQIEPQFAGGANAFNDAFNPADANQIQERFLAPTNFTVRVLQTSHE